MVKEVLHVKDQRVDSGSAGLLSTGDLGVYSVKEELRHTDVPHLPAAPRVHGIERAGGFYGWIPAMEFVPGTAMLL